MRLYVRALIVSVSSDARKESAGGGKGGAGMLISCDMLVLSACLCILWVPFALQ